MKKVYEKPMICYEGFASSTNLAAGCEKIVTTQTMNICGIEVFFGDEKMMYFTYGADGSNCTDNGIGSETTNDGFCYHNPTESTNLFNS